MMRYDPAYSMRVEICFIVAGFVVTFAVVARVCDMICYSTVSSMNQHYGQHRDGLL